MRVSIGQGRPVTASGGGGGGVSSSPSSSSLLARRDVQHAVAYLTARQQQQRVHTKPGWTEAELLYEFAVAGISHTTLKRVPPTKGSDCDKKGTTATECSGELVELGGDLFVNAKLAVLAQVPSQAEKHQPIQYKIEEITVSFRMRANVDVIMRHIAAAAR